MKRLRIHLFIFAIGLVILAIGAGGCGPTQQEIMAMEKAKQEAEEARLRAADEARKQEEERRKAEEARLERLRAAEEAGNEAARQGQLEKALGLYREVLKKVPRYSDQDQRVRQNVILVVRAMATPPALPESVLRSMVRGETKIKLGGAGSYEAASAEMEQAVLDAPWLADGYYNLGIVQEKAGKFRSAMQNLRLYLAAAPQAGNAGEVQAKIYEIEVLKEEEEKMQSLQGAWRTSGGGIWKVSVEGNKLKIPVTMVLSWDGLGKESSSKSDVYYNFELEKKGQELKGFATISSYKVKNLCVVPGETNPVSGTISGDGRSMKLSWKWSKYTISWANNQCTGVALLGKQDDEVQLTKSTSQENTMSNAVTPPSPPPIAGKKLKK